MIAKSMLIKSKCPININGFTILKAYVFLNVSLLNHGPTYTESCTYLQAAHKAAPWNKLVL